MLLSSLKEFKEINKKMERERYPYRTDLSAPDNLKVAGNNTAPHKRA
jgi:hypothetical protein